MGGRGPGAGCEGRITQTPKWMLLLKHPLKEHRCEFKIGTIYGNIWHSFICYSIYLILLFNYLFTFYLFMLFYLFTMSVKTLVKQKKTFEKNWRSQNFDFPSLRKVSSGQFLVSFNSRRYH